MTADLADQRAAPSIARPDRAFYRRNKAFGRFGMRWFRPVTMAQSHTHGHIEMNWLSDGRMHYEMDGHAVTVPPRRLALFWAGIPHQSVSIDRCEQGEIQQCNIYLPLDAFLHMPHVGPLHDMMLGGGMVLLSEEDIGPRMLRRWYADYRTGDPERQDILKVEIAAMIRRAVHVGWEELLPAWSATNASAPKNPSAVRYVVAMVHHIINNLTEPLSLEDVASVAGLHPNYALNLFTAVMHTSVRNFIIRMRIMQARTLLFESNLSIANVAFQSGFSSLSQFYVHFRQSYGVTPLELRRRLVRNTSRAASRL